MILVSKVSWCNSGSFSLLCLWAVQRLIHMSWPVPGVIYTTPFDENHVYRSEKNKRKKRKNPATLQFWLSHDIVRKKRLGSPPLLSFCQQRTACFTYFPETALAFQQGQQKMLLFSSSAFCSKNLRSIKPKSCTKQLYFLYGLSTYRVHYSDFWAENSYAEISHSLNRYVHFYDMHM